MKTLLTIVIPVYNVEPFLRQCLMSLPEEGCRIILVNDGSTDSSPVICADYAATRPHVVIVDKPNGGLSDARNAGMVRVDTPYVFFLDSDDYVDPTALMAALDYAEANSLDWLQCGYAYAYADHNLTWRRPGQPRLIPLAQAMEDLAADGYIKNFAWGKIYRTELIRHIPFPKGKYFEDSYWQYRVMARCSRLGIYPAVTTFYRQRAESISATVSERNLHLLEGLCDRLDFFRNAYPAVAPQAAVSLWKGAHELKAYSRGTIVNRSFAEAEAEIRRRYARLIASGIRKSPFFARMALKAEFNGSKSAPLWSLLNRVASRFRPSKFRKQ